MVQGVLGTHAHQSNYSTERKINSDDIQVMPVNLNLFLAPKTRFYTVWLGAVLTLEIV